MQAVLKEKMTKTGKNFLPKNLLFVVEKIFNVMYSYESVKCISLPWSTERVI